MKELKDLVAGDEVLVTGMSHRHIAKVDKVTKTQIIVNNLGSASYLTYHWRQYSFEQLEKEMVRVCGLCHKALGIPQDDSVTDFERGQWSVIQNIIGYAKDYSLAAQLCREAGIGYKKIKALQKDCGYSYKEEVNDFLKDSRNDGTDYLKLEE